MSTPKRRFNLLSLTFIVLCFKKILEIKYETEKYIAFKANKISQFKKKWGMFEVLNLI